MWGGRISFHGRITNQWRTWGGLGEMHVYCVRHKDVKIVKEKYFISNMQMKLCTKEKKTCTL